MRTETQREKRDFVGEFKNRRPMKFLNEERKDFSDEYIMLMAAAGWMVYGAQIIIEKCARVCDLHKLEGSFFQSKRLWVKRAAEGFDQLVHSLEKGFDGWFDDVQKGRLDYCNFMQQYGNDAAKLMILFMSRTEDHPERRNDVYRAIRELPPDESQADWEAIIDNYFNRKF